MILSQSWNIIFTTQSAAYISPAYRLLVLDMYGTSKKYHISAKMTKYLHCSSFGMKLDQQGTFLEACHWLSKMVLV